MPTWVKSSINPPLKGKYYAKCLIDGDPENHIIEWDGKSWGEVPDYDCYESSVIVEWLDEDDNTLSKQLASARKLIEDIRHGNIYQDPADECDKWLNEHPQ